MRIANIMFGRGLGGIEQAFLDYNEALLLAGHEVLAVTHPLAEINPEISGNLTHETLSNRGSWDIFAARALQKLYREWKPEALISHGNRAIALNLLAKHPAFHIAPTHNYHLRRFAKLDGVIAITLDLKRAATEAGVASSCIELLPNMVRVPAAVLTPAHTPPVIGAMGRMVEKKGFALLLQALVQLHQNGVSFRVKIGGTGPLENKLEQLSRRLGLAEIVEFTGWVDDKQKFFESVDIFCLPSLHEPFGIVLLEAMAHGRPVVGFRSEGPAEIIQNNEAVLVETGNAEALTEALGAMLALPDFGTSLGLRGQEYVGQHYALPVISQRLDGILREWCHA